MVLTVTFKWPSLIILGLNKGKYINILISSLGPALNAEISLRSLHLERVPGLKSICLGVFMYFPLLKPNVVNTIINNNNNNNIIDVNDTIININNDDNNNNIIIIIVANIVNTANTVNDSFYCTAKAPS